MAGLEMFEESGLEIFGGTEVISTIKHTGAISMQPSGDADDYFQFSVTSDRPLITAIGNYLVLGKDATTGHSLDADDVLFGEDIEVDGMSWLDGGATIGTSLNILNDILFTLGTDNDQALLNRSTSLTANTALADVLVGTPIVPALAANSFILSNVTTDGDIVLATQTGGNSQANIFVDASAGSTHILAAGISQLNVALGRVNIYDDIILQLGTGGDQAFVNRSATLTADTALANVLIGTPDTTALTANSLIISNTAEDGDILIACNDGGASKQMIFMDGSTGITHLGKPGTPNRISATGDVYIAGFLEIDAGIHCDGASHFYNNMRVHDNIDLNFGASADGYITYELADADAKAMLFLINEGTDSGNNVPAFIFGETTNVWNTNLGIFDEVVQPTIACVENSGKYTSSSAMTAAGAGAVMTKTGIFTNSAIGDIVRVTAGTNATAGWYWITTVTDADNVTLDRNWCTGAVTDGVMLAYHDFTMLSAHGVCTRCTDGAPDDTSVDIDRPGWLILDLSQANGRLYWRVGDAWHYVDATA